MKSLNLLYNRARKLLADHKHNEREPFHPVQKQTAAFVQARFMVPVFYWVNFFMVTTILHEGLGDWVVNQSSDFFWPVFWVPVVGTPVAAWLLAGATAASSAVAAVWPTRRPARIAVFVSLFFLLAFNFSMLGKINHGLHAWLFTSLFLSLIPSYDDLHPAPVPLRSWRQHYLDLFWASQAFFFLFYSMSGVLKVAAAGHQLLQGRVHAFHPEALALQIAGKVEATGEVPLLGGVILDHPWLGWLPYLMALYLEVFAFVAVFRPRIHRTWGVLMGLFHVGNAFMMSIVFNYNVLLLGLLFVLSPFRPKRNTSAAIVNQMPLLGPLVRSVGYLATRSSQ